MCEIDRRVADYVILRNGIYVTRMSCRRRATRRVVGFLLYRIKNGSDTAAALSYKYTR